VTAPSGFSAPARRTVTALLLAFAVAHGLYQIGRAFLHPKQGLDLAPAYLAFYTLEGKQSTVALSLAANPADARSRAEQLGKYFTKLGKLAPRPDLGPGANLGSTSYEGEVVYAVRGRYVVLVVNPPTDRGGFLKTLIGAIPEAD